MRSRPVNDNHSEAVASAASQRRGAPERLRRQHGPGFAPLLVFAPVLITCSLLLTGCSHHTGTAPGARVFVNLPYLVQLRPEWQGVSQINDRLAGIRSTGASLAAIHHFEPRPVATPLDAAVRPLVLPLTRSEDIKGLDEAIRVSTPSAATIRAELERETSGAQELFVQTAHADYQALVEAARARIKAKYALLAVQIRRQDETRIINLRLRLHILNMRLVEVKSGASTVLSTTVSTTPPGTAIENEIAATRTELGNVDAALAARLKENQDAMHAEMAAAEADYQTRMLAAIQTHNAQRQATIAAQVAAARLDIDQEARQRQQYYQSAVFVNPLRTLLSVAHPLPPQAALGPPTVANPALGQTASQEQAAALTRQRDQFEQFLVADTRLWVQAIAARKNWVVSYTGSPRSGGAADATPQLAAWIRELTIPPETGH